MQTPEAGELTTPGRPCLWWTVAFSTIRWDDDTLRSGRSLVALGSRLNPMCQLTSAAQRRAR